MSTFSTPQITVLGEDSQTRHRLNANAFQQSAISTFRGWQYAALYTKKGDNPEVRRVTLARRCLSVDETGRGASGSSSKWSILTFEDYDQIVDDGHNTISLGVCTGDGSIHLSFDHHCDDLHFRMSCPGLAMTPERFEWSATHFTSTMSTLPGLCDVALFRDVSYPRFVRMEGNLLFECRHGMAGAGSNAMFLYDAGSATYRLIGTYLVGVDCNPYPNGVSYSSGRVHVSWTNRGFFGYESAQDPAAKSHKQQAGPNGPENNYDLMYAYSDDGGQTWCNTHGTEVARCNGNWGKMRGGILPSAPGIVVTKIPKQSGIINQEAQWVDGIGNFHVLNRDNSSGREMWRHFWRDAESRQWRDSLVPGPHYPTETGARGKIVKLRSGELCFVLPGNTDTSLTLLKRHCRASGFDDFEFVWRGEGYDGEPLVDEERLKEGDGVLSIFIRTAERDSCRNVLVLDFSLSR